MPRLVAIPVALLAAVVLAACGSSSKSLSSSAKKEGKTVSIPAVTNATDLKAAPSVSAGTPPPPTTLQKKDLVVGTGAEAVATNTVNVQYYGANYADGKEFDSSWKRGQPATFPLNRVVPGFSQGIVGMKVGGRRVVVIPPDLGYGAAGSPPAVGPDETLVFVIDLLGVQ
jgi:peptidylprolyl isomerase